MIILPLPHTGWLGRKCCDYIQLLQPSPTCSSEAQGENPREGHKASERESQCGGNVAFSDQPYIHRCPEKGNG